MTSVESSEVFAKNHRPVPTASERFLEFLGGATYPCVGAKSALARGSIETHEFKPLGDRDNDQPLLEGLSRFVSKINASASDESTVHSCVAIFRGPFTMSEHDFESSMWSQLWRIHELDVLAGNLPADEVSDDAESPHFSLSLAGHPFFLIGLHPRASRLARRFSHPVLVFNSHQQFERLRKDGRFEKMQAATRSRDIELRAARIPTWRISARQVKPDSTAAVRWRTDGAAPTISGCGSERRRCDGEDSTVLGADGRTGSG